MSEPVKPFVGEASSEYRAVCAYSPAPGQPTCDNAATVHVMVIDHTQHGRVGLPTCNLHLPTARASGEFLMEHPHRGYCGLPATCWDMVRNVCILDDTGEEPALRGVAAHEMESSRG
jgi:hypothetical protein